MPTILPRSAAGSVRAAGTRTPRAGAALEGSELFSINSPSGPGRPARSSTRLTGAGDLQIRPPRHLGCPGEWR